MSKKKKHARCPRCGKRKHVTVGQADCSGIFRRASCDSCADEGAVIAGPRRGTDDRAWIAWDEVMR